MRAWRVTYRTLIIDEMSMFLRYWVQMILPPVVNLALYFVVFGVAMGNEMPRMNGHHYTDFLVPGIVMILLISYNFSNTSFPLLRKKVDRSIQELLVAPISNWSILCGYLLASIIKTFVLLILVSLVLVVSGHVHIEHGVLMFVLIILISVLCSMLGIVAALFFTDFQSLSVVQLLLTPLIYTGGVFYSIQTVTGVMKWITLCNPLYYMITLFRYSSLGGSGHDVVLALVVLVGLIVVSGAGVLHMLNKGTGLRT